MSELYDITIVGGGPVGLFAAFYAHLRQAKVKIIDSLPQLGGQPAILYPEKKILDVPGFTNLSGEELTQRLIEQLETFQTEICLNETVLDITKSDDGFTITTSQAQHQTKTIIIPGPWGSAMLTTPATPLITFPISASTLVKKLLFWAAATRLLTGR